MCEGDLKTIKKIAIALENKLPVIIMKGSGKAADLVLDFLEKYIIYISLLFKVAHYILIFFFQISRKFLDNYNKHDVLEVNETIGKIIIQFWIKNYEFKRFQLI